MFDLETFNDQEFAEAYAADFYELNLLREKWDRDLTREGIEVERKNGFLFHNSCGNPGMSVLKNISENYKGDVRFYINTDGDEIISWYNFFRSI